MLDQLFEPSKKLIWLFKGQPQLTGNGCKPADGHEMFCICINPDCSVCLSHTKPSVHFAADLTAAYACSLAGVR